MKTIHLSNASITVITICMNRTMIMNQLTATWLWISFPGKWRRSCESEIKGVADEFGSYRIYFKAYEKRKDNKQYNDFMLNLANWSQKDGIIQKKQHDDAPDSLAGLIINILSAKVAGRASSKISLDKYGL